MSRSMEIFIVNYSSSRALQIAFLSLLENPRHRKLWELVQYFKEKVFMSIESSLLQNLLARIQTCLHFFLFCVNKMIT